MSTLLFFISIFSGKKLCGSPRNVSVIYHCLFLYFILLQPKLMIFPSSRRRIFRKYRIEQEPTHNFIIVETWLWFIVVYCVLSVLILIHYNYYNCAKRPHGIGSTTGVFSLELSVFVRLLQPTSVSNFPWHVISRATS